MNRRMHTCPCHPLLTRIALFSFTLPLLKTILFMSSCKILLRHLWFIWREKHPESCSCSRLKSVGTTDSTSRPRLIKRRGLGTAERKIRRVWNALKS